MQYYTFTSWQQVEDWIRDNGLVRWTFAALRDGDGKMSQYVALSDWCAGSLEDKIAFTKKNLESQPGRYLYGSGWHQDNKTGGEISCEVMLSAGQNGVGGIAGFPWMQQQVQQQQPIGEAEIGKIEARLRKEIMADIERKEYEREKVEFEKEKKEFEADKAGVMGAIIGYAKPYLPLLKEKFSSTLSRVAGTDKPVVAKPIQPIIPEEEPDQHEVIVDNTHSQTVGDTDPEDEQDVFTDEENEKLFDLLKRFKAVEPDYLRLLESVVVMAEAGDDQYTMAKMALLNK